MALRNVAKALAVFTLLVGLTVLPGMIGPALAVHANQSLTLSLPNTVRVGAAEQVPLTLRIKIDPSVLKQWSTSAQSQTDSGTPLAQHRYIVRLKSQVDIARSATTKDPQQGRAALVATLRETAHQSQISLVEYLERQEKAGKVAAFTSYWIFNGLAVASDFDTLLAVADRPEVETILSDRVQHLSSTASIPSLTFPSAIGWNISLIGADKVWNVFGVRGQGVVVANLDTGVDWTHVALQRKYRGYNPDDPAASRHDYNWFDATQTFPDAPDDDNPWGHGTHTMGTMVGALPDGRNQVGVAPDAQWIAVKVFNAAGDAYDSWIHAAFQWIMAPTDLNGQNPDPSLAPDICSNSWGWQGPGSSSDMTFWDDVLALRAAGIFPVFSIGNEYEGSLEASAPATYPQSFAVSATDSNDQIDELSCRGPSPWGEIKPELAAPGVEVRSTLPGDQYGSLSGTSMAAPHVAGVVALLWQAQRQFGGTSLDIAATEQILTSTAHPLTDALSVPNNTFGWGRVDAYQALGGVVQGGTLQGRVTDAASGQGVPGAVVTAINQSFGGRVLAWCNSNGYYTLTVTPGIYDVTASQFYYMPHSMAQVDVPAHITTQLDLHLTAWPVGQVLGRVLEVGSGNPVTATLQDRQHSLSISTDVNGCYTLTLPLGDYALQVVPSVTGHRIGQVHLTLSTEETIHRDLTLEVSPKILLVDAGVPFDASEIQYYQTALETLLYSYDSWNVTGFAPEATNVPPAGLLCNYDVVLWSQPQGSPGYIGAWASLSRYLLQGKRLLISGQDIGYWDASQGYASTEYADYLHAGFVRDDSGVGQVIGMSDSFLAGITLTLDTSDSAGNQVTPSEIVPLDGVARSIFAYPGDGCAALAVEGCDTAHYRVVYLAFGLEGAGPETARVTTLKHCLEWLWNPDPVYDLSLYAPVRQVVSAPSAAVTVGLSLLNLGGQVDAYRLSVEGNRWPVKIWDASHTALVSTTTLVSPCAMTGGILEVSIPSEAVTGDTECLTLRATSVGSPTVTLACSVTATCAMPWSTLPPLPTLRHGLAVAPMDECRFVAVGGWTTDDIPSNVAEMYDLRAGIWHAIAPKPTATADVSAATIAGKVYVPGGMGKNSLCLATLEIYDPAVDRWSSGPDLPHAAAGMATCAARGKLYVFGGSTIGGGWLDRSLEYDPTTQIWRERAPMPSGHRTYAAAAELDGKIYVAGGWPDARTFECYDPAMDLWAKLPPMPTGRHSLGLIAVDGCLYACGGGAYMDDLNVVERYDPSTNAWTRMSAPSSPFRAGCAAVALAGRIIVVGEASGNHTKALLQSLAVGTSLADSGIWVDKLTVGRGERLSYTITLRNPGQQSVSGAMCFNDIPNYSSYVPDSLTGSAHYNASANRVEWYGSLPARSSQTFGYQVIVEAESEQDAVIRNTAWISDGLCVAHTLVATTTVESSVPFNHRVYLPIVMRVRAP